MPKKGQSPGPLDGELREVEILSNPCETFIDGPAVYAEYTPANGIARHESVSEEEVARRVALWRKAAKCWHNDVSRWEADCNELAEDIAKSIP